jgi:hypothetical protein
MSAAFFMVGQSDVEPIMTPTTGAVAAVFRRLVDAAVFRATMLVSLKYRATNPIISGWRPRPAKSASKTAL